MCVAAVGKLIEINGSEGKANVRGNVLPVELGIVEAKIGDFMLIHAGCAIAVITKSQADEMDELLNMVNDYE